MVALFALLTKTLQMSRSIFIISKFACIHLHIIALMLASYWNKSFTKEIEHFLRTFACFI